MHRSRYVTLRTSCSSASPFACRADYLPSTRRHPQCPRLHAGRPGQGCHLGSRPLSRTQPGNGAVVLGPRDANQVATEPAQHLQGTQSRSGLSHSRHGRPNPMGTTGRPAPQHYAHRARACRQFARQTRLERAHRLRYRALLSAAPTGSLFGMGVALPSRWSKVSSSQPVRARQPASSAWPPRTPSPLSANRATAELPAFMGSRPFSAANRLLEQHGSTPVNWTCLG